MFEKEQNHNPYEFLKGEIIFVGKERDQGALHQATTLRAKVLDVSSDGEYFKVEYTGNENLLFEGKTEDQIPLDEITHYHKGEVKLPVTEDMTNVNSKTNFGEWRTIDINTEVN